MADTLSEIYNNTLGESDFNSSGEATILTTNSSTAHVIKNVQVDDTDAKIKVDGTLQVNGFDIVALSAASSGSEIVAPSSTVKVKAAGFPLRYSDDEFNTRTGGTNYISTTIANVNEVQIIDEIHDTTNSIGTSITNNGTRDVFAPFIGSNNYHYIFSTNYGSSTTARIYDNAGSEIYTHSTSYTPKWFDGEQYAYFYNATNPQGITRIDIETATSSVINATTAPGNPGSDAASWGVKDEFFWFYSDKNDMGYVYDFQKDTVSTFMDSAPVNVWGSWPDGRGKYAIKRSNGSYRFVIPNGNTNIRWFDWNVGDVHTSSTSYSTITGTDNPQYFSTYTANHVVLGTRLYFLSADNKISFCDFEPDTPEYGVYGSNNFSWGYGSDLGHVKRTPDATTIAGRTYGISPSLKLRMTGVTST